MHRYILACLMILVFSAVARPQKVVFHVYDAEGKELRWDKFRHVEENWRDIQTLGLTERTLLCDVCKPTCRPDKLKECSENVCDPAAGDVDILLEPSDLTVLYDADDEAYILQSSEGGGAGPNGFPTFEWPEGRTADVTLALAWPTQGGYYSTLLLDIPKPDPRGGFYEPFKDGETPHFVFNFVVARQTIEKLEEMLRARVAPAPGRPRVGDEFGLTYRPSETFTQQHAQARALLAEAAAATNENDKGKWGARAFDAAVEATLTLLKEYGVQYAGSRAPSPAPQWAVTFETVDDATFVDDLDSVSRMVDGSRADGWVRLIFHKDDKKPEAFMPVIKEAHRRGLHVLGMLRDSQEIEGVSRGDWQKHVERFVNRLSGTRGKEPCGTESEPDCDVDEWEVGNEVTGEWTAENERGDYVGSGEYILDAAEYVRSKARKPVLLTLFWQLGNLKNPRFSMFEWLKKTFVEGKSPGKKGNKSPLKHRQDLFNDIGISLYPDKTPMGVSFDRVVTTLRSSFFNLPGQRIMITELGYWPEPQTDPVCEYAHVWRLGAVPSVADGDPHRDEMRGAVAQFYQAAVLGYPYTGGGPYWWYYLQERGPTERPGAVWTQLHDLYRSVRPPRPIRIR
jgi:hypothetical protein